MEKKLYLVETVSIFRQRYVVEAREAEHACDEVVMNTSGVFDDNFREFSQKHIDETIISSRELSAADYVKRSEEHTSELQSH